ncbi:phage major tail protein, TP901-1 family [Sporolactobacillus sp. KGMB 08714]|uniref:phage major tail protein, TP901-1 family n=1 Tax=Sporolactobacillus sp. KGMB 08714 TaxID=3064704 RepID=UPI002FBE3EF3
MATDSSAQPTRGKSIIALIQSPDAPIGSDAILPLFQTDGSFTYGGDLADEQTKNGRVLAGATIEESGDFTYYMVDDEEAKEILIDAKQNSRKVKVWYVNVNENTNGKHDATFFYGVVDEIDFSYPQDGFVEINPQFQVIGKSQRGEIDLDASIVEAAQYAFEAPGDTGTDPATSVAVDPTTVSLAVGATKQLTATVLPASANQNVTYSSSVPAVATVNSSGLVTAIAAGSATITVQSVGDSTKQATCEVTVTAAG